MPPDLDAPGAPGQELGTMRLRRTCRVALWRACMPVIPNSPDTPTSGGMTGEADWETLLSYTGEVTEEVIRSWWADVPVGTWATISERLNALDADDPKLSALIRRVTGL